MAVAIQYDLSVVVGVSNAPAGSGIVEFYTENQFGTITGNTTTNSYSFENFEVIEGTGISVVETIGNLSYEAIIQEVRNNLVPYFFERFSVYANNIEQANTQLQKVNKAVAGVEKKTFNYPTILYQNKFAVINVPMNFAPKTINKMVYKLGAFEEVKIIINYTKGNLNTIVEVLDAYVMEGVPFNKAIKLVGKELSPDEIDYIQQTLRGVWEQRNKELGEGYTKIEIDNILEPQEVINEKKNKLDGEITKKVRKIVEGKSKIKSIVSDYVAKGKADEIYDPYNYVDGSED